MLQMLSVKDLGDISSFLFDCDGVLFRGSEVVPGAPEVLARLRSNQKRLFFVTNNATKSRADNVAKLAALGISASVDEVVCSSFSAACFVRDQGFKKAFVVGEEGLVEELKLAGIETVQANESGAADVDVVVAGLDRHFNYEKLAAAQRCIHKGAAFVATNRDATYPAEGGAMLPGAGSIISALETCSGKAPMVTGKPSEWFVEFVKKIVGTDPSKCLMIGDRLDTDIAFGLSAGFKTMLVTETGVHSLKHVETSSSKPNFHTKSVADFQHVFSVADMMLQFLKRE